jgi:hypothetical protein
MVDPNPKRQEITTYLPSPDLTSAYSTQLHHIGGLFISHVIAPAHIEHEDAHEDNLKDLMRTVRGFYGNSDKRYSLAIVQGMDQYPPAAKWIQSTDVLIERNSVEDCFVSPEIINHESLKAFLSDESNAGKAEAELSQSYHHAMRAYAHKIVKTTERCPGYETAAKHLSDLMEILNNQSASAIAERLKNEKGRVLIYCLQDFALAVIRAVSLLGKGD